MRKIEFQRKFLLASALSTLLRGMTRTSICKYFGVNRINVVDCGILFEDSKCVTTSIALIAEFRLMVESSESLASQSKLRDQQQLIDTDMSLAFHRRATRSERMLLSFVPIVTHIDVSELLLLASGK